MQILALPLISIIFKNKLGSFETDCRCKQAEASRTNSTFGFCRHKSQRAKNQKSCFLPTLKEKRTE